MKNLFIPLVAAALFAIGCQENTITDPVVNEPSNKVQSDIPGIYLHGVIPLEGVLSDPHPVGNSFYRIHGQIDYDFRIIYVDPIPPAPQRYASIYIETNADLKYFNTFNPNAVEDNLAGFITEVSEEYVPLGGNFVSLLEKTYAIQGRDDGMVLKVRFSVTPNKIELSAMWLALPGVHTLATEINHY
jgi:hypothetical protein